MDLPEKLIDARKKKKFTQSQLAQELQVTRQTVLRWEHGTAVPSTDNLRRLSQLYGVSLGYFLDEKSEGDISVIQEQKNQEQKNNNSYENRSQKEENPLLESGKKKWGVISKLHKGKRHILVMSFIIVLLFFMICTVIYHHSLAQNSKNVISYSDLEDASKGTSSGVTFSLEW